MKIIDFLYNIYNGSTTLPAYTKHIKLDSVIRHLIILIARIYLPIHFAISNKTHRLNQSQPKIDNRNIIVSLTSFPARIDKVWLVIESIIRQEQKPHKIVLWLSNQQFSSINTLPSKLLAMQGRGLEIRLVDGDIRSHKKYAYTFKEYQDDYVILIDDDILYPSTFIKELLIGMKYEDRINCSYGSLIQYDNVGKIMPYTKWKSLISEKTNSNNLFFGSGGGTAFIPKLMYKDCCNYNLALSLCPTADDIWLNAMARIAKLKCCKVRTGLIFSIVATDEDTLCSINIGQGKNDIQLSATTKYYKEKLNIDLFSIIK